MKRAALLLVLSAHPLFGQERAASGSAIDVRERQSSAREQAAPLPDIEVAYRAFATGELEVAEKMLTRLVERRPSPAAFLLRGCTRYTRAMLARVPGDLMLGARGDVRRAFELNQSLWLDPDRFSPRLIAFLEEVRQRP